MAAQSSQRRAPQQAIEVIMRDGSYHRVPPRVLDVLLDNDRVQEFQRASGWVTVGIQPIRAGRRDYYPLYYGPERRNAEQSRRLA